MRLENIAWNAWFALLCDLSLSVLLGAQLPVTVVVAPVGKVPGAERALEGTLAGVNALMGL